MKDEQEKRKAIESIVSSHNIWKKVAQYYADLTGKTRGEIHNKFIDFLVREDFKLVDNQPKNVLCFVFSHERMDFVNKTMFGIHDDVF